MNNKLKETFDKIHAEEELKEQTKVFIADKTKHYTKLQKKLAYKKIVPAVACFLFLMICFSGYRLYFTQTSVISIDINPSFELNLNRFNRVISINYYNDDGLKVTNDLDIQFMDYRSALDEILKAESIVSYLNQDEMLSISVAGRNEQESKEILDNIETCIPKHQNHCCDMGNYDDVDEAHAAGLSVSKYRAFLELQKLNPDITVEDVKGLTMRQIRDLIGDSGCKIHSKIHSGNGNNGQGQGHGKGRGKGHRHGVWKENY